MPTHLRRLSALFALALLACCGPAFAGVRADFNGDGVLDSATLESGRPVIDIELSGTGRTVVLVLRERPQSLVAMDFNRDGRIDLAGLSKQRHLVLFQNGPGERFIRLRRPGPLTWGHLPEVVGSTRGVRNRGDADGDEASIDSVQCSDHSDFVELVARCGVPTATASCDPQGRSLLLRSLKFSSLPSRAPPV